MYNPGIAGLVTSYALIAALLLIFCMYSRWSWKIKVIMIVITTAFYLITYFSYHRIPGWPTAEQPPRHFRLLAAYIEPPDPQKGHSGAIYLWLVYIDDLVSPAPPRAYRFAYSDELHGRVLHASSKLNKGIAQLGELEDRDEMREFTGKNMSGSEAKSVNILFYDLPDNMFPDR